MTEPAAAEVEAIALQPESQPLTLTYWELVWRDFRRNRGAMFGAAIVLFVIVVAVFCPLLANQRPLYISAMFPHDYDNALAIVMEQSRKLATVSPDAPQQHELALRMFDELAGHLAGETDRERLDEFRKRLESASPVGGAFNQDELLTLSEEMEVLYDARLRPVVRYPAIRSLTTVEVLAIAAFACAVIGIISLRRIRNLALRLLLIATAAAGVTFLWKSLYPTINDARPYRQIITSADFKAEGGRAIRTPVPYGENENVIRQARTAPSWLLAADVRPPLRDWHWLGTDTNGRDVLARMTYGARVSMIVGLVAVSIYTIIGVVLGAIAGYYGRWIDIGLSRLIEVVICFPPLMVILAVQAFLRPSLFNMILALAALWWTSVARLQRAEFLRLVNQDFVQSVRGLGGSSLRIIFLHILPNGLGPILVLVSFGIAGSIVIESALSFLGFGVPQPMASWGDLLNNGRNDIQGTWWLTVFPGIAIFLTVTCFNLMGEGVRDALDPRKG